MSATRNKQPVRLDSRGVPITTSSGLAVEQLDDAVLGLVGHRADTGARVERALASDPGLVPALCLQGFALRCLGRRDLEADARARVAAAQAALAAHGGGTMRERGLVGALAAWCDDRPLTAAQILGDVLTAYPRDLLAIKLSHALNFILGRSFAMRAACERILPAWDERVPGYGYVLGCYAFALEETDAVDQAEAVGRRAFALEPLDAWGAHAVAHAFETRDRAQEGVAWLAAAEPQLAGCNNFAGHLAWHRALFHLQLGEAEQALALYDARIAAHLGRDYRDLCNGSTLLWRLEREGVAVGDRWQRLAELALARIGDHASAFADVHYVLALAGSGDLPAAVSFVSSMRGALRARSGLPAEVLAALGLPLAEGIVALAHAQGDRALASMLPVMHALGRLGGSRAQRDIFALLAIEAARQGTQPQLARTLVEQRLAERPDNRFALRRVETARATPASRTSLQLTAPALAV